MHVKECVQVCHLQDFMDVLRHVAQFQVTAIFAHADQQPYQHSQAAAVDEDDVAEVQHDVRDVLHKLDDMDVQELSFTPSYNASAAPDDGDISHCPGFQL